MTTIGSKKQSRTEYATPSFAVLGVLIVCASLFSQPAGENKDVLEARLRDVDNLRTGSNTEFDEVERRCRQLLDEYRKPDEQARIYLMWAHVEFNSGMRHPDIAGDCAEKALSLPLDLEKRLDAWMYLGRSLEGKLRGVAADDFRVARRQMVIPHLSRIVECVELTERVRNTPLPPPFTKEEVEALTKARAWNAFRRKERAIYARDRKLKDLEFILTTTEECVVRLYSRPPFAEESELDALASKLKMTKTEKDRLLAAVAESVAERKRKLASEAPIVSDNTEAPKRDRNWLFYLGLIPLLLVVTLIVNYQRTHRKK